MHTINNALLPCPFHACPPFPSMSGACHIPFSLSQSNINLRPAFCVNEYQRGHYCKTHLFGRLLQFVYLALRKQQFTVALCLMVVIRTEEIRRNVHAFHPYLSVVYIAITVNKRGFSQAYGFYLRTCQHYTGSKRLNKKYSNEAFLLRMFTGLFFLKSSSSLFIIK